MFYQKVPKRKTKSTIDSVGLISNIAKTTLLLTIVSVALPLNTAEASETAHSNLNPQTSVDETPDYRTPDFWVTTKLPADANIRWSEAQTETGWCQSVRKDGKTKNKKQIKVKTRCYLDYLSTNYDTTPAKVKIKIDYRKNQKRHIKYVWAQTPGYTDAAAVYLSEHKGKPIGWCNKNGPINIKIDESITEKNQQNIIAALQETGQKTQIDFTYTIGDTIENLDQKFVNDKDEQTINIITIPADSETFAQYPTAAGLSGLTSTFQNNTFIHTGATIGLSPGTLGGSAKLIQAIVIHELGHSLGLNHTDPQDPGSSVMRGGGQTTWGTSMTATDIQAYNQLYHSC